MFTFDFQYGVLIRSGPKKRYQTLFNKHLYDFASKALKIHGCKDSCRFCSGLQPVTSQNKICKKPYNHEILAPFFKKMKFFFGFFFIAFAQMAISNRSRCPNKSAMPIRTFFYYRMHFGDSKITSPPILKDFDQPSYV